MSSLKRFQNLIRFIGSDGLIHYGDAIIPSSASSASAATEAFLVKGNPFTTPLCVTSTRAQILKLLSPIAPSDVGTLRCLGLNYRQHANELSLPFPEFPVLFFKPTTTLAGPTDPLIVPRIAQRRDKYSEREEGAPAEVDYEVELVIVIGPKPVRDVPVEKALDYVLGYTVGNDYSQRTWQSARGGGQWSLGKMYDGWAPIGPAIVAADIVGDPQALHVSTTVNGTTVQDGSTGDMIFSVAQAVSFLSQGSTLMPGDLIFTGTPSGVGAGRTPRLWLKHGDEVTVSLSKVGSVTNTIIYESAESGTPKL
ncbi:uncharacterized protein SAPINGB_P005286 [Magnusiomyces paraingens]|uniref:Fumarylacetoacetase-like C-terminal domain-containing protein n=1 Tax=Magnusiomyces paraingens TaxID=2606893 RepID=A0A5E8BYT9_9ASCO|nr:uncharacterized protein SAPINGB_P005286 [Saprochaete ingens]VVT56799.1 unnamed protein product [Saprochaete ingens]